MSENAVDIVFRTRAELEGARAIEEQLQRQIGQAKALGKNYTDLQAQLEKVQAAIKSSPTPAGPGIGDVFTKIREGLGDVIPGFAKLDGILAKFAGGTLGAIAGGFAALAGGLTVAKAALDKFASAEQTVAKLDAALAQAGLLTDSYRGKLQGLAHGSEQWLGVLTRLTQFDAKPENIESYMQSVKDLAGILGGDIEQAAHIFSIALQGNFEMLHRYGIRVDESKTKVEQLADAQAQMAQHGRGQLDAANEGIAGGFRKVTREVGNLLEALGQMIAQTQMIQAALGGLAFAFNFLAESIPGLIPKLEAIQNKFKAAESSALQAADETKKFAEALKTTETAGANAAAGVNKYLSKLKELQTLQDRLEDAQMAAELGAARESGLTGSALSKEEARIHEKYAKMKFDRGQAAIQQEIGINDKAFGQAGDALKSADADVRAQEQRIAKQKQVEKAQADALNADNELEKAAQRMAAAKAAVQTFRSDQLIGPGLREELEDAEGDFARASRAANQAHGRADRLGPGGTKSAADLQRELDQLLKPRREAAGKAFDAANERQEGNPVLRDRFQYNQKIFGYQSAADRSVANAGIAAETEAEQKKQKEEAERRTKDNRTDAGLGLAPVQGSAQSLNQATQAQGAQLSRTLDAVTGTLQDTTATLQQHARKIANLQTIVKDIKTP